MKQIKIDIRDMGKELNKSAGKVDFLSDKLKGLQEYQEKVCKYKSEVIRYIDMLQGDFSKIECLKTLYDTYKKADSSLNYINYKLRNYDDIGTYGSLLDSIDETLLNTLKYKHNEYINTHKSICKTQDIHNDIKDEDFDKYLDVIDKYAYLRVCYKNLYDINNSISKIDLDLGSLETKSNLLKEEARKIKKCETCGTILKGDFYENI